MKQEIVTILGIVAIAGMVLYFTPFDAKDIVLAAISGLVGYLAKEAK